MAARDIISLDTHIAPGLLRILYPLTLLLIFLMLLVGMAQGIRTIASPPRPARPPMMTGIMTPPAAPQAGIQQPPIPRPGMMGRGMMGPHDAYGRGPHRRGPGLRAVNPVLAGTFMIVRALLIATILTMVVRILAEMALAVLALPKSSANALKDPNTGLENILGRKTVTADTGRYPPPPPELGIPHTGIVWSATFDNVNDEGAQNLAWKAYTDPQHILSFQAYEVFVRPNQFGTNQIQIRFLDRSDPPLTTNDTVTVELLSYMPQRQK